jgi:hypothetical protein
VREINIPGEDGALVPMVAEERTLPLPPNLKPIEERIESPRLGVRYLILGVLLAALIGVLTVLMPNRSASWSIAFFGAAWSLLTGLIGVILLLAWLATRHVFWVGNENVLLFTPLSLFLAVLIPAAILSGKGVKAARAIAGTVVLASLIAAIISLWPGGQENHAIVALMLPVHVALYAALRSVLPSESGHSERNAAGV